MLLPLLAPAIVASAVLVFVDAMDNFVTVRYLAGPPSSEPLSVKIYSAARVAPAPAVNAVAAVVLVSTLLLVGLGWAISRRWSRGWEADPMSLAGF